MKKMKLKQAAVLSALMGVCFSAGVYASNGIEKVEAYVRGDIKVVVKGVAVELAKPPLIYNDTGYLPLRAMGDFLKADIVWDEGTQTIYVNPRIYDNQPRTEEKAEIYGEIELVDPFVYTVNYLGREHVLMTNNYEGVTYYRVADLQRMGIETGAFKKSKDKITGALYVRKEEANKAVTQQFKLEYTSDTPVSGETDPKKIEVLRNFAPGTPQEIFPLPQAQDVFIPKLRRGYVYIIDALPQENEYELLFYDRKYYRYRLKLANKTSDYFENGIKRTELIWYVSYYQSEDLQPDVKIEP